MEYTKGEWKAWRFSKHHNWKVSMGDRNEFLDLGQDEEAEANAQLIASAPDLYEALAYLNEHCSPEMFSNYAREKCRKALTKAEGK